MKCDAKDCDSLTTENNISEGDNWTVYGISLCVEHRKHMSGG